MKPKIKPHEYLVFDTQENKIIENFAMEEYMTLNAILKDYRYTFHKLITYDIFKRKLYEECSIFEFEYHECFIKDYNELEITITKHHGYFYFDDVLLKYRIKCIDTDSITDSIYDLCKEIKNLKLTDLLQRTANYKRK